jgi:hypothetical protein
MTCFRPAYLLLYWIETLHTATYNLNRQPTKTLGTSTLFFALYSTHQHILISVCLIVRVTKTCHLQPHINYHPIFLCVFLGYSTDHEGYKCLDLQSNRIINLHHVVFDEFSFPFAKVSTTSMSPSCLDCYSSIWLYILTCRINRKHQPIDIPWRRTCAAFSYCIGSSSYRPHATWLSCISCPSPTCCPYLTSCCQRAWPDRAGSATIRFCCPWFARCSQRDWQSYDLNTSFCYHPCEQCSCNAHQR